MTLKRIDLPVFCSWLLFCFTALSPAQIETTQLDNNLTIHLPQGDLNFFTSINGRNENNNWIGPSISNFSQEGDRSVFTAVFADGQKLSFERTIEIIGDTITARDSWTVDSSVTGHIHYEVTVPMDSDSEMAIETDGESMSLAELSKAEGMQYFLRNQSANGFIIRNILGADLSFSFNNFGRFEVMTVEQRGVIHLRFYVDPESSTINDFQTGWSLRIKSAQ